MAVATAQLAIRSFIVPCGLGDHMEPRADGSSSFAPERTPVALTSTAYYYFDVWMLARAAEILGKKDDAAHYGNWPQRSEMRSTGNFSMKPPISTPPAARPRMHFHSHWAWCPPTERPPWPAI